LQSLTPQTMDNALSRAVAEMPIRRGCASPRVLKIT
jgi:hypothetical protein